MADTKKARAAVAGSARVDGNGNGRGAEGEGYDPNAGRRVLMQLQARHGRVGGAHRAAFDSLGSDARRIALGGRTRAAGVLAEGVAWAVRIDAAYESYRAATEEHYSRERFAYYLDRLLQLDAALVGHGGRREGTGLKRATAEERASEAAAARKRVIARMEGVAGARAVERKELDGAIGTAEDLSQSILDLVKVGRAWLARQDPQVAILCASARLTEEVLSGALAAGAAMTSTGVDAALAGRKVSADSPAVNLAEGWVLQEMEEAQRCFGHAHEESGLVPRLTAGAATRHVLGRGKGRTVVRAAAPGGAASASAPVGAEGPREG